MKNLLLTTMPVLLWVMTGVNLLLMLLLFAQWRKKPNDRLPLIMAISTFGLVYDALVLSLGTVLAEGPVLQALSLLRFVLHAGLIPLLLPVCGEAIGCKGWAKKLVWGLTLALIVVGVISGFSTVLQFTPVAGVARYASDKAATPGWATGIQNLLSYVPVVLLMICGIVAWIREKNAYLFFAGLGMFVFAALGPASGNKELIFYITMYGEVLMTLFFLLFVRRRNAS